MATLFLEDFSGTLKLTFFLRRLTSSPDPTQFLEFSGTTILQGIGVIPTPLRTLAHTPLRVLIYLKVQTSLKCTIATSSIMQSPWNSEHTPLFYTNRNVIVYATEAPFRKPRQIQSKIFLHSFYVHFIIMRHVRRSRSVLYTFLHIL
jgi:hypothetical protein